jgi:hypothetical protein
VPASPTSPGQGRARPRTALINEKLVGQANIPVTIPLALGIGEELAVGRDRNAPFPAAVLAPPDASQDLETCRHRDGEMSRQGGSAPGEGDFEAVKKSGGRTTD